MQDIKQFFADKRAEAQNRPLKELPEQFRKFRFDFKQIAFNGERYIYQVETGVSTHYEVFERKIEQSFNMVSYPTDNAFGDWAKCVSTIERAKKLFDVGW